MAKVDRQPDWRTNPNPDALLDMVRTRPPVGASVTAGMSDSTVRRLRFCGVVCAHMVWDMLSTDAQSAVVLAERRADHRATRDDVRAAAVPMKYGPRTFQQQASNAAGWASYGVYGTRMGLDAFVWDPAEAAREAAKALATRAAGPAPTGGNPVSKEWQAVWNTAFAQARAHQAELIRDIFPPPGYTPSLHPDWRTDTVVMLARQMDETGEYSAVPILADALQDAGCYDEVMLNRCRAESGVHCRGNWVVDLVLGRA